MTTAPTTANAYLFSRCSQSILAELVREEAEHSAFGYWSQVMRFLEESGERPMTSLTARQRAWVRKIHDQLLEEAARPGSFTP